MTGLVSAIVERLIGPLAILLMLIISWLWLRSASFYLNFPFGLGFVGLSGRNGDDTPQAVPRDRFERILERFVEGDLFDTLGVSWRDDPYEGVVLSLEGNRVQMDVSFYPLKESQRIEEFKKLMAGLGHTCANETPCNVGLGPDSESVTLEYLLPLDLPTLTRLVDRSLEFLQGPPGESVYVFAWHSGDFPSGTGIKVRRQRDVLSQVP